MSTTETCHSFNDSNRLKCSLLISQASRQRSAVSQYSIHVVLRFSIVMRWFSDLFSRFIKMCTLGYFKLLEGYGWANLCLFEYTDDNPPKQPSSYRCKKKKKDSNGRRVPWGGAPLHSFIKRHSFNILLDAYWSYGNNVLPMVTVKVQFTAEALSRLLSWAKRTHNKSSVFQFAWMNVTFSLMH